MVEVEDFVAATGDLPRDSRSRRRDPHGATVVVLARWLRYQRLNHENLTGAQRRRLESIRLFVWAPAGDAMDDAIERYELFIDAYGRTPRQRSNDADERQLALWLQRQLGRLHQDALPAHIRPLIQELERRRTLSNRARSRQNETGAHGYRQGMTARKSKSGSPSFDAVQARDRAELAELVREAKPLQGIDHLLLLDDDPDATKAERAEARRDAPLFRAMLWHASVVVVDELFLDHTTLSEGGGVDDTMVLSALPPAFSNFYSILFTRKLVAAAVEVTHRLTAGWRPLACTAQEILLDIILDRAEAMSEFMNVSLPDGWKGDLLGMLVEDTDFMGLYSDSIGNAASSALSWFEPFNVSYHSAPYVEAAD